MSQIIDGVDCNKENNTGNRQRWMAVGVKELAALLCVDDAVIWWARGSR